MFPIVSNAVLLPMFFLSGGLYPLKMAPQWMRIAAHFDPVAYAVDLMRGAVLGDFFFPVYLSVGRRRSPSPSLFGRRCAYSIEARTTRAWAQPSSTGGDEPQFSYVIVRVPPTEVTVMVTAAV